MFINLFYTKTKKMDAKCHIMNLMIEEVSVIRTNIRIDIEDLEFFDYSIEKRGQMYVYRYTGK